MKRHSIHPAWLVAILWLGGCAVDQPVNPSFQLTVDDAEAALDAMRASPVGLRRPVVILGGFCDPGLGTIEMERSIRQVTGDDRIISVSFFARFTLDNCREHAIDSVEDAFPSSDPNWTMEVDVIAGSMGGIVARYAAMPIRQAQMNVSMEGGDKPVIPRKRLKIARLFTISTPHLGANLAELPTFDSMVLAQRAGSDFLAALDAQLPAVRYRIYPYVRLHDQVVGAENAAPPGRTAWWVPNQPFQFAHISCMRDERIIADIARRLRGEPPFTTEPAAPIPTAEK